MGSQLRLYDVTLGKHKTRLRLNDADAAVLGDSATPAVTPTAKPALASPVGKSRPAVANKARTTPTLAGRDITEELSDDAR